MAHTPSEMDVYVARRSFWFGNQYVEKGTTAHAGHEIVQRLPDAFVPARVDFEYVEPEPEPEPEAPPRRRGPGRPRKNPA